MAGFNLIPFKNKLLALIYFSNGAVTYYLASELHKLFLLFCTRRTRSVRRTGLGVTHLMLFQIIRLTFVSCLELIPGRGAQYVRSSGVSARILNIDVAGRTAVLRLPSGIKKIFSYTTYALLGKLANSNNKNFFKPKSGY